MKFKLHKWLFSFALIATLASFSSYATTSVSITTTEWLQKTNTKDQVDTFYVDFNYEDTPTFSFVFYGLKFSTFLLSIKKQNQLSFNVQQRVFNLVKTSYLNKLITLNYIHNSVSI